MALCDCNLTLANTGANKCTPVFGVGVIPIIVPLVAADGTANNITISGYTGDQTFWDGLTQNADRTKRYYPLPKVKNVEDVRADAVFETFDDGSNEFVREGTRTYQAELTGKKTQILGNLKSVGCTEVGVYFVDDCKQLIGNISADGTTLDPIPLDANTWQVTLVKPTGSTVSKLQLNFEFDTLAKDEDLRILEAGASAIDLSTLKGLGDLKGTEVAKTATSFDISLVTKTLSAVGVAQEGIEQADWVLFNSSLPGSVAVTGSEEGPAGQYSIDFSAQTGGDIMKLSVIKSGCELFEFEFIAV